MDMAIRFLGAAENVTGSRHLVDAAGARFLVDCGLYQERHLRERNWDPFPVPPKTLDAVLLTHAHLDHCGLLPKLCREGFRGKVYCTPTTADVARIVLLDSAGLQEEDAQYKQKRHASEGRRGPRPEAPLYTTAEARACLGHLAPVRYGQPVRVADGVTAVFRNVGHILGAAWVAVTVEAAGEARTIVFSGDVGRWDAPILKDPALPDRADYVLVESTYGDRTHPSQREGRNLLAEVVSATARAGGNVVVPSFAIGRTQDLLYHLSGLADEGRIPRAATYVDSPMAISVTEVLERHPEIYDEEMRERVRRDRSPFDMPGLHFARSTAESKAINAVRSGAVILAGAGMCTGGRIKHHLAQHLPRPESTILFVGYQAAGTLGREIVEGANPVRIHGCRCPVRARIAQIGGFSAHADRDELLRWLSGLGAPPRRTFVVHGEPETARGFADLVAKRLAHRVTVPQYGERIALD